MCFSRHLCESGYDTTWFSGRDMERKREGSHALDAAWFRRGPQRGSEVPEWISGPSHSSCGRAYDDSLRSGQGNTRTKYIHTEPHDVRSTQDDGRSLRPSGCTEHAVRRRSRGRDKYRVRAHVVEPCMKECAKITGMIDREQGGFFSLLLWYAESDPPRSRRGDSLSWVALRLVAILKRCRS